MKLFKNKNIEGVTNLNACYGGTAAILNCISWGKCEGKGKFSIVVMSDVAVYDTLAAEPTSGVGAVAILMGPNPKIILESFRFSHFDDMYDFYKPNLEKEAPIVDGKLSQDLYSSVLLKCWEGLEKEWGKSTNSREEQFNVNKNKENIFEPVEQ